MATPFQSLPPDKKDFIPTDKFCGVANPHSRRRNKLQIIGVEVDGVSAVNVRFQTEQLIRRERPAMPEGLKGMPRRGACVRDRPRFHRVADRIHRPLRFQSDRNRVSRRRHARTAKLVDDKFHHVQDRRQNRHIVEICETQSVGVTGSRTSTF